MHYLLSCPTSPILQITEERNKGDEEREMVPQPSASELNQCSTKVFMKGQHSTLPFFVHHGLTECYVIYLFHSIGSFVIIVQLAAISNHCYAMSGISRVNKVSLRESFVDSFNQDIHDRKLCKFPTL